MAKKQQQSPPPARMFFLAAAVIVGGLLMLNVMRNIPRGGTEITNSVPEGKGRRALTEPEAKALAPFIAAVWNGKEPDEKALPKSLQSGEAAAYVQVRAHGNRVGRSVWRDGKSAAAALEVALKDARGRMDKDDVARADSVVIELAYDFHTIDPKDDRGKISNVRRGVRGIEFIWENKVERVGPTEMIATNRDFQKTIEAFEREAGVGKGATSSGRVRTRIFEADQLFVRLPRAPAESPAPSEPEVELMFRGNQVVDIKDVTRASTQHLADELAGWLFRNLQPNGRMVYMYWPSRGDESNGNNMIRQWMATVAMGRVARKNDEDPSNDDRALLDRVAQNIDYNISQFYQEDGDDEGRGPYGLIDERGQVKLGAIGLAALAMAEHPDRARWEKQEKAIQRTMDYLWQDSGRFVTFYRPITRRHDNENFYPGEALLYWATLLEKDGLDLMTVDGEMKLLDRFMKVVWFYKDWHLSHRNPAFIPWHTQAYYKVWSMTKDEQLKDWTFEMNDWLLGVQEWSDNPRFPDTNGRFYDSSRPFGPPHASSTGVYLEGLIFAWKMAMEVGDQTRAESYRRAIVRGLRSCMQLTFFDDVDMYYISKRDPVRGGVRTTVYDNSIRVDNVQHNLMGQLNILRYFPDDAYRP